MIHACIHALMATKTISIDMEAYERLRRARRHARESFSQVIKRAEWPTPPRTAGAVLKALDTAPLLERDTIEHLDQAQRTDAPPEDEWRDD